MSARPESVTATYQPRHMAAPGGPAHGSAQGPAQRKFRPEIQGLRAVALGLVVAYHVWLGRVSGGVDVFLLISAFLMTGQFADRYRRGVRVHLGRHWIHTFRRLLPAAAVTIAGTVFAALVFLPGTRWASVLEQAWASLAYVENFVLQRDAVDYYAGNHAAASPFQHFWSLSIQGQVFLLFPLLFVGMAAVCRRLRLHYERVLFWLFAAVFLVSLGYSVYFTAVSQSEAYFDTLARLWEFALGALLALVSRRITLPRRAAAVAGWAGLASIVACGLVLQVDGAFPGFAALWPTLAAGAVILAGVDGGPAGVHRILTLRPLQRLGDISYGLYLWHWPLLVMALAVSGKERMGWLSGSAVVLAAFVLGYLTTRFVDRPWRAWSWPESSRRRGLVAVAACAAVVALPVASVQVSLQAANYKALANASRDNPGAAALVPGYSGRPDPSASLLPLASTVSEDWARLPEECSADLGLPSELAAVCTQSSPADPAAITKNVLVLGNSHSQQWLAAFEPIAVQHSWRLYQLAKGGCFYDPEAVVEWDECNDYNKVVAEHLAANPPDAVVLVGTVAAPSSPEETLTPGLERLVEGFLARGIQVVAMRDNPRFTFNMADCVSQHGADALACRPLASAVLAEQDPLVPFAQMFQEGFFPIDMTDYLCPAGDCRGAIGNVFVYLDDNHLTNTYTASMSPMLEQRLLEATGW
ncbi:acyltransferase family protein [Sinomonas sp. B1-1]|uniref:acyltransferase family protein n=1 Tax=Sinomonas sp. B1-1 TaxID=3141454 RepID=UPI003D2DCEE8